MKIPLFKSGANIGKKSFDKQIGSIFALLNFNAK